MLATVASEKTHHTRSYGCVVLSQRSLTFRWEATATHLHLLLLLLLSHHSIEHILVGVGLGRVVHLLRGHLLLVLDLLGWCLSLLNELGARCRIINKVAENVAFILIGSRTMGRLHLIRHGGAGPSSICLLQFLHSWVVHISVDVICAQVTVSFIESTALCCFLGPDIGHVGLTLLGNLFHTSCD